MIAGSSNRRKLIECGPGPFDHPLKSKSCAKKSKSLRNPCKPIQGKAAAGSCNIYAPKSLASTGLLGSGSLMCNGEQCTWHDDAVREPLHSGVCIGKESGTSKCATVCLHGDGAHGMERCIVHRVACRMRARSNLRVIFGLIKPCGPIAPH